MGIKGFFGKLFGLDLMNEEDQQKAKARLQLIKAQSTEIAVRELAWEICIQRIAKALSKCEFRTYEKGREVKKELYYRLNVSPNPNQNATQFWEKVVHKLYTDMEVLIIPHKGPDGSTYFYVADSFLVNEDAAFYDHMFKSVVIGKLTLKRTYAAGEVIYFKLQDGRIKGWLDSTLDLYGDLIKTAYKAYKQSNAQKYKFHINRIREDDDSETKEAVEDELQSFIQADTAVITEFDGLELNRFDSGGTVKDTRDLKALIDDVIDITCKALLIPTNIMTGQVTDTSKAMDDFLTFRLDSTAALMQDEMNRKIFPMNSFLAGDSIWINTLAIKHVDLLDMATAVEKLLSSGVESINDIRRLLGEPEIEEDWANAHFLTKNFSLLEDLLNRLDEPEGKEEKP